MRKLQSVLLSILCSILFLISPLSVQSTFASSPGTWTYIGLNNLNIWTIVSDPTNSSKLYAGTSDGVYQSTDSGSTWTATSNQGTPALVVVISPTNHNILYATYGNTGIQKSIDGGSTWNVVTNNLGTPVAILDLAINPTDPNTVLVASYGNCLGIRKTTDGGATWNGVGGGCDLYRITYDPTNQNIIYAGGTNLSGYIAKSTNGGSTWTLGSDSNHLGNDGASGAVRGIAVDPNNSSDVYVGQEINGIYKTNDSGVNWNVLSSSPATPIGNALAISPLDSSIYARSSNGVSTSSDGGNTWLAINTGDIPTNIEKLIILPNDPYNLYAATSVGIYVYGLQSANLSPAVNTIPNATINTGGTYSTNGSFTDSDSTSWTATVDYGDGTGVQPLTLNGMNFSLNHVYTSADTYTVTVTVTDNQGASGQTTATVTVHPQVTLNPLADAFVERENPNNNFGSNVTARVDDIPKDVAFIKFNTESLTGKTVINAKLRLYVTDVASSTVFLKDAAESWSESAITWNNRPNIGNTITTIPTTPLGTYVEVDISSYITSHIGERIAFALTTNSNNEFSFATREATNKPQLVITYQ